MVLINIVRVIFFLVCISSLSIIVEWIKNKSYSSTTYLKCTYEFFSEFDFFKSISSTVIFFIIAIFCLSYSVYNITLPKEGVYCYYVKVENNQNETSIMPAEILISMDYDEYEEKEYRTMWVSRIFWDDSKYTYIDYNLDGINFYKEFYYDDLTISVLDEKAIHGLVTEEIELKSYISGGIEIVLYIFTLMNSIFYFRYKEKQFNTKIKN